MIEAFVALSSSQGLSTAPACRASLVSALGLSKRKVQEFVERELLERAHRPCARHLGLHFATRPCRWAVNPIFPQGDMSIETVGGSPVAHRTVCAAVQGMAALVPQKVVVCVHVVGVRAVLLFVLPRRRYHATVLAEPQPACIFFEYCGRCSSPLCQVAQLGTQSFHHRVCSAPCGLVELLGATCFVLWWPHGRIDPHMSGFVSTTRTQSFFERAKSCQGSTSHPNRVSVLTQGWALGHQQAKLHPLLGLQCPTGVSFTTSRCSTRTALLRGALTFQAMLRTAALELLEELPGSRFEVFLLPRIFSCLPAAKDGSSMRL